MSSEPSVKVIGDEQNFKFCGGPCGLKKPLSEFHKRTNGKPTSYCKDCNSANLRKHYTENKSYYKEKKNKYRKQYREFVQQSKIGKPCVDCGREFHPSVMHYDHLPGFKKTFAIAAKTSLSLERLQEELNKCELVCAICHGYRTFERKCKTKLERPAGWL